MPSNMLHSTPKRDTSLLHRVRQQPPQLKNSSGAQEALIGKYTLGAARLHGQWGRSEGAIGGWMDHRYGNPDQNQGEEGNV